MTIAEIFKTMDYGPAPESADAAKAWLADHHEQFDLFIGGKWQAPEAGAYLDVHNPATGEMLAQVADAAEADIDKAVKAARKAQKDWAALSGHQRARYLYALARNIQKHARLLSVVESMDNGKPIRESRDLDIPLVARHFYYHAGWAQLMGTELRDYQPVGVIGQVIPWNFPLLMLAWKIAPALAMGNTVVLKPAPYTPLSALVFAEIVAESGLPAGVVNIVTGGDEAGVSIVAHPDIDKIAFTGSTQVGRIIRQATAGTGKKLSLELGGKSPFVVFEDADQDGAIEGLVDAIWFNQGQVCCAGSRLLVQENIADAFIQKLKARMAKLRTGDPLDKTVDLGAVVDPVQYETIDRWVKLGVQEGATLFQPDIPMPEKGCYYPPTLLTDVSPASTVVQEEIFGPVLTALTFRTPQEAIALANNTRYGLAASIWTENINVALEVAHRIKAGSVWVNSTNLFDAASGFGGYRESGYGREGGKEGLYEYVRPIWQTRPTPNITLPMNANGKPDVKSWAAHTPTRPTPLNGKSTTNGTLPTLDRTAKMYIGGKQKRPDGAYTRPVLGPKGVEVGQVGDGNRKDIRDAVEAAHGARGWADRTAFNRAQVLYYIAENLSARSDEFANRLVALLGATQKEAQREVDASIDRLFTYAAWADKYGGTVQETTLQGLVVGFHDTLGVIGIACPDEAPLLSFISLIAPAIARGNTVVAIPSEKYPLLATDFYQVLDTSDVPGGVVNIVTGTRDHLTQTLAEHEDVDAMWYFGSAAGSAFVEYLSASNMKRTWVNYGEPLDWYDSEKAAGERFLHESIQVKNIWVPSGV
ncbi:aldehyde dehydrogenase family protein [Phototrophicus methaneseepsis]|uniref:Aldehyde dehydrogenase family protein n=1 Tax=Phototrophicus methaneseepsis TaxID=2710758 RepID=A0A7S8EBW3_9CHLR|nr:aldehyde dehydrogenase family protein [Phototrophicus methaneseepsis]QPC84084.1 aldehyde dehydrogenase family protein [Phototrophicus methaneseepsis]